jgi:hypothetical protein
VQTKSRSCYGLDRIGIKNDGTVNVYMRGAGKAFAFRCNPYDYRSKQGRAAAEAAAEASGEPSNGLISPEVVTTVRDGKPRREKGDPEGTNGESWRYYGVYQYLGTVVPRPEEFRRLETEEKRKVVVDRFMCDLRATKISWYYQLSFEGVYLDEEKTQSLWDTRFEAAEDDQRAAITRALETIDINISYNIFRYSGPVRNSDEVEQQHPGRDEVEDCVRNREQGRRLGHIEALHFRQAS